MKYRRKANNNINTDIDLVIDLGPVPAGGAAEVHHVAQPGRPGAGGQEGAHPEEGGWCGVWGVTVSPGTMITMVMMQWSGSLYCTMPFTKLHVFKEIFGFTSISWPLVSL